MNRVKLLTSIFDYAIVSILCNLMLLVIHFLKLSIISLKLLLMLMMKLRIVLLKLVKVL